MESVGMADFGIYPGRKSGKVSPMMRLNPCRAESLRRNDRRNDFPKLIGLAAVLEEITAISGP
jgi:hypothetical protein